MTTVLTGIVTRGKANWLVGLQGLPEGKTGLAMGTTWSKARSGAQEMGAYILGEPEGSVVVDLKLEDAGLQALIDDVWRRRAALEQARDDLNASIGIAARTLARHATLRDVGSMLGYSFQYVARFVPKAGRRT
jgi:hypothetical protein